MTIDKANVNGPVGNFFALIRELRGIAPIAEKMHGLLCSLQKKPKLSDDAQKVLYIYLSLLEDGNTRIPLDAEPLFSKWRRNGTALSCKPKVVTL